MRQQNDRSSILSRSLADRAKSVVCITPGCGGLKSIGRFGRCFACSSRYARFGSYTGRPLPRSYYSNEWSAAAKFLRRFKDHPSVIASLEWIAKWLRDAQLGKPVPAAKAVARLADRGSIEEISNLAMIELTALTLYAHKHAGSALLTPYMFAVAFLKSYRGATRGHQKKPYSNPPRTSTYIAGRPERGAISKELRLLNPCFIEMLAWFDREEKLRNAQFAAKNTPFPTLCDRCRCSERKKEEYHRRKGREAAYIPPLAGELEFERPPRTMRQAKLHMYYLNRKRERKAALEEKKKKEREDNKWDAQRSRERKRIARKIRPA